jgi:hypothetical protein
MYRFDNNAAPPSLINFISELDPQNKWGKSKSGLNFIEKLKVGFREQLKGYFVDTFIIAKAKNEYFCMFFFTSHIYGYHKMLEAKWSIDEEEGRGWVPTSYIKGGGQTDMFEEAPPEVNTGSFEKKVREFISIWRTNKELYEFTLNSGFLPKHISPILKNLKLKDLLEIERLDGVASEPMSFFLTYENYKEKDLKLKLKLVKR